MSASNSARVAKCRAQQKRVELLFRPEEYRAIESAANGQPIGTYIKELIRTALERDNCKV